MTNLWCHLAVGSACALLMSTSNAQITEKKYPKKLFAVSMLHFDAVREPHGTEWYLRSREGKVIIGSIAAAAGVSPFYIALAVAQPSAAVDGEETHYVLPLESGYAYCGTRIRVTQHRTRRRRAGQCHQRRG